MRIQSHLFVLVLGAIAPLVAVLAAGGVVLWKSERESLQAEAIGRARAAMSAIDTQQRGSIAALNALAASKSLDAGNMRAFHEEAQRSLATHPQWRTVRLATAARVQVVDAVPPFTAPEPFADDEAFEEVIRTGAPAISGMSPGVGGAASTVRVRIPVRRDGEVRYVLTAYVEPTSYAPLLHAQRLPSGWTIALADRALQFIARVPPAEPGSAVSTDFRAAIERAPEGWFAGRTLEGTETFTAYVTSEISGWVLGIAMPAAVVRAGAARAARVATIGGVIALGLALCLAWAIAKRITLPIARLADAADRGLESALPGAPHIEEIARLHKALGDAARAVGERQRRLEEEQAMLRTQSSLLAQRTAEAETLMQVMPIAVFKSEDPDRRTFTANPAGLRFLGVTAATEPTQAVMPIAWPAGLTVVRDGRELPAQELPLASAIAEPQAGEELEFRFADGSVRFGFVHASPLTGPDGSVRGSVCAILDITERKLDDRRKDEFLATLAHELRNPLAPAMNALALMRTVPRDAAAARNALEILERQLKQMKRLIDDLMDVSRITQGRLVLQRERVALAGVVRDAIDACRPLLSAKGHRLDVELPGEAVDVEGDPARLTQMLSNLLGNSCKFTPPGGSIRLEARAAGRELTVSVVDNGSGIAPELLPRVFDLFMQGDRSLERTTDGLGIGLSLVQRLARMHGGRVEAVSDGPGKGAQFILSLPIVVGAAAASQATEDPAKEELMAMRILVVDDSRDAADSLATLLELSGHTVETANDGASAIERAEQFHPHVIFMDIGMPKVSGYDAARRIRAASWGRDIRLVAISGWGQESDRAKSQEAGFDAHLVKPVEYAALERILGEVAGRLQGTS